MYKIDENAWDEKYVLLIPAMLDAHFPLIKYAFYSKDYHPVILSNEDHITDVGLKYVNKNIFTVQFHPEACAGPLDTDSLFDTFMNMMEVSK